jgi:hypothetical protein
LRNGDICLCLTGAVLALLVAVLCIVGSMGDQNRPTYSMTTIEGLAFHK